MDSSCTIYNTQPVTSPADGLSRYQRHRAFETAAHDIALGRHLRFSPVTAESMDTIVSFLNREKGRTTDFSFGGFFMWVDYFKYSYCIHENTLFIMGVLENNRAVAAFSLPIGELPLRRAVDMLRGYCMAHGLNLEFSAVPEYALEEFHSLAPTEIAELEAWGDYLYDAQKLATLSGKKMSKKRNHVNRFMSLYDGRWAFEPLTSDNYQEALSFLDVYAAQADKTPEALDELQLNRILFADFPAISKYVEGALLKVDGKVCAVTLGDIKGDTLFVHIEKALREIDGSYEAVNKLFAEHICAAHTEILYINREDDAGDEGLRNAKRSYHPLTVLKKYNIRF